MGAKLAQQLVGAGEHVVDVPAKLSARVRLLERGRIDKTDPNDARSAAIVAWRTPALNVVTSNDEHTVVLRLLADRDHQITAQRTRSICRLHALLCLLIEGGTGRSLTVARATGLRLRRLEKFHIPVGGRRFRPTLEDFIEFLHAEGFDPTPRRLAGGDRRAPWRLAEAPNARNGQGGP